MDKKPIALKEIRLVAVFHSEAGGTGQRFSATLDSHELIFCLEGHSVIWFDGQKLIQKSGDMRFLPKGKRAESALYLVETQTPSTVIDVFFDSDCPLSGEAFVQSFGDSTTIRSLFYNLLHSWQKHADGSEYECLSLLYRILFEMDKAKQPYLPKDRRRLLLPGLSYLDEHFCEPGVSAIEAAGRCGMGYDAFRRLFARQCGTTPNRYVTDKRMRYAGQLLRVSHCSVTEAAQATGYENAFYFSRVFKQYVGCSPREYGLGVTEK